MGSFPRFLNCDDEAEAPFARAGSPISFRVPVGQGQPRPESGAESRAESGAESLLRRLESRPLPISEWARACGARTVSGSFKRSVHRALELGLVERTLPEKPNSRLQQYRLTEKGKRVITSRREQAR